MTARSLMARTTRFFLAGILVLLSNFDTSARGDRPHGPSGRSTPEAPAEEGGAQPEDQHWFEALANAMDGDDTTPHTRDHAAVLDAFREAVDFPSECMVRVLCDNEQVALGTVVGSDGLVVTKGSELGEVITCELSSGARYHAELAGVDRGSDLALLKIAADGLPTIRWSDESLPAVGGWVVTPGLDDMPQAIGVVSVAPHHVRGGVLGIQLTEDEPGPRITHVVSSSGAAEAGLSRGDIILKVNGDLVRHVDELVEKTGNLLPGEEVRLLIRRDGEEQRFKATLGSVSDTLTSRRARFQDRLGSPLSKRRFLFPSAMEHDSLLAPNQCGGVLVDLDGKAIGVNIARASRISSYAIPAHVARPIIESLASRHSQPVTLPVAAQPAEVTADGERVEH